MDGHAVSPLDLSRTLLVGGGLLVPHPLSGSPVIKLLMQMVTMVPGQGGRFQSVLLLTQAVNLGGHLKKQCETLGKSVGKGGESVLTSRSLLWAGRLRF